MSKTKGCVNRNCSARQKKIKYKENDIYCSKCGQKLAFVCPKCYTVLQETDGKYCVRCSEGKKDKKESAAKVAGGIAAGLVAVAGAALSIAKVMIKKNN